MWKTVKSIPDIDRSRKNSIKPVHQKPAHHFSVDCSQSHKGLFFGILIIVMTIIAMIMYFVLYTQPGYELVAAQEVTLWETIMYLLCAAAVITGKHYNIISLYKLCELNLLFRHVFRQACL